MVDDEIAGDPVSGERWVRRSLQQLQRGMSEKKYTLCCETIRRLLLKNDIRLKSNVKRLTPKAHPDRDLQFRYIQFQKATFDSAGYPRISVDSKKKELIGPFYNNGQVWCEKGTEVNTHDFPGDATGKATPYGIYDERHNMGFVYVGQSADTGEFAVDCIVRWWEEIGCYHYPKDVPELLIFADGGGSNGYRPRLWRQQLQEKLVDAFNIAVTVCHYPSGASKWNPIEHRLFSEISKTWAGTPLTSYEVMLEGIRNTKTRTGLQVQATLIEKKYEKGKKVNDEDMAALAIKRHSICPMWNYTIKPRKNGK